MRKIPILVILTIFVMITMNYSVFLDSQNTIGVSSDVFSDNFDSTDSLVTDNYNLNINTGGHLIYDQNNEKVLISHTIEFVLVPRTGVNTTVLSYNLTLNNQALSYNGHLIQYNTQIFRNYLTKSGDKSYELVLDVYSVLSSQQAGLKDHNYQKLRTTFNSEIILSNNKNSSLTPSLDLSHLNIDHSMSFKYVEPSRIKLIAILAIISWIIYNSYVFIRTGSNIEFREDVDYLLIYFPSFSVGMVTLLISTLQFSTNDLTIRTLTLLHITLVDNYYLGNVLFHFVVIILPPLIIDHLFRSIKYSKILLADASIYGLKTNDGSIKYDEAVEEILLIILAYIVLIGVIYGFSELIHITPLFYPVFLIFIYFRDLTWRFKIHLAV